MYNKYIKRILDILLSIVGIVLLSLFILILMCLVKIKLGSPIFFTQERPGKNKKIFSLKKFRTMTDKKNSEGELLPDEMRLTKFGQFLRNTSLDELPELWNILKGDMSFIGPRPLLVGYLLRYSEEQNRRHNVRPGLTGLAQVNGRNLLSWEERFKLDVEYVENISLGLDCKIIFMTIKTVFKKEGVCTSRGTTMKEFMGEKNSAKQTKN